MVQSHRTKVQLVLWIQRLELLMSEIGEIVSAIGKLGNGSSTYRSVITRLVFINEMTVDQDIEK